MTTRGQAEAYRSDLDALLVLLLAELVRAWRSSGLPILPGVGLPAAQRTAAAARLTSAEVATATDALLASVPSVVADFQAAAASLATDFFDGTRSDLGVPGRFTASPVQARDDARQEILVRWATQPLRTPAARTVDVDVDEDMLVPDLDGALLRLIGATNRQVLAPARDTIAQAVAADPADATWAREAREGACAFCALLATRGAVYGSRLLAGGDAANRYHDDCSCLAVPSWPSALYEPPAYVADWEAAYNAARDTSGSGELRPILAAMRTTLGSH